MSLKRLYSDRGARVAKVHISNYNYRRLAKLEVICSEGAGLSRYIESRDKQTVLFPAPQDLTRITRPRQVLTHPAVAPSIYVEALSQAVVGESSQG